MKFFLTFITGTLIGYILAYILASFLLNTEPPLTTEVLVKGKPDSSLVRGEVVEKSEIKTQSGEEILYKSPLGRGVGVGPDAKLFALFEKTISLKDSLGSIDLEIKTYPPADSIDLSWFANIKERTFERVDTLFITRTDTLTITKAIEQPRAFYDNFWVGAAVTAVLVFLFSGLK